MNIKYLFFSFSLLFILQYCITTLAQPMAAPSPPGPTTSPALPSPKAAPSPPSPHAKVLPTPAGAPAPPGPTNVTKILEKAGHFSIFMRLLRTTSVLDQIEKQLNDSSTGMTIFAPTDDAFSSLSFGTLNSLNDGQKEALMQFHVISSYIPLSQFQTVSNPIRTNAGDSTKFKYPLNVTAYPNSVKLTSGITNTSIAGVVYSDGQLAIYQINKVLLPWDIFGAKPPALAPTAAKPKDQSSAVVEDSPDDDDDDDDDDKVNASASGAVSLMAMQHAIFLGAAMVAAIFSLRQ